MNNNIENLKKAKEEQLALYTALVKSWKEVKFPTKKDGTAFKNPAKNFVGAKYYIPAYSLTDCNYVLEIHALVNYPHAGLAEVSDTIYCAETLKYMKHPINPSNIRKQGIWVEDQYLYDLNEIKTVLIPERIKYYTEEIQKLTNELQEFDNTAEQVDKTVAQLKNNNNKLVIEILKNYFR